MPDAPDPSPGDSRIVVAVLDGPVDLSHPCFAGARVDTPWGMPTIDPSSHAARHGTHVASIIFGQPGSSLEGIAPGCRGLALPVFTQAADRLACSQLDLARAILTALEHGAHFINVSGGQLAPSGAPDPLLEQAIERCRRRNVLIVAAAGNDGCECLHVPAAAANVLAVGAMDMDGRPLASSNWGPQYRTQGVLAPGLAIEGAVPGGGSTARSGTSYATPQVTAHAALLASWQLALGRHADPHAVREAILASAKPCPEPDAETCSRFLAGRLDVEGALRIILEGTAMSEHNAAAPAAEPSLPADLIRMSGIATPPADMAGSRDSPAPPQPTAAAVLASDCGCGCGGNGKDGEAKCGCGGGGVQAVAEPALVYALGRLGYDFGSEARRDSIMQTMTEGANNPLLPELWLKHLEERPYEASSVIWTLNLDATPIYAVRPAGAYAETGYRMLRDALNSQLREGAEIVSVPGVIGGSARLESGQVVPIIVPAIRGVYSWATEPLVAHVLGARPKAAEEQATYDRFTSGLSNFLSRVYYDLRNLGITGEERALNYSATNAVQIASVIRSTTQDQLDLDTITVRKSPVCRPDSECYDVELAFFNPANTNIADRVYRFTVDVSDVVPVTVGTVRSWTRRA